MAEITFITAKYTVSKSYYYKVYDSGSFVTVWSDDVLTKPTFRQVINAGYGEVRIELARSFDNFGEDVDVKLGNTVQVYCIDIDDPNGQLIYTGYISGYKPIVNEQKETVEVTLWGFNTELTRMILRNNAGETTIAYNSYDPSNILKDVIDKYRELGGTLSYTNETIDLTNTVVSYTFNTNTIQECIDKIIELSPDGWYFRIDPNGLVYLKNKHVTADHSLYLAREVKSLETYRRIEDVVNRVLFIGAGSPALFRKYENTGSQAQYGLHEIKKVDQRVSVEDTAQIISQRIIDSKKDPEIRSIFKIIDNNGPTQDIGYDIESIQVGETIKINNLKQATKTYSYWDTALWDVDVWDQTLSSSAADVLQIVAISYAPDEIIVEASSRLPQVSKRIEDINRNLEASQTVNNPSSPT